MVCILWWMFGVMFLLFKQKTAYEWRISDWSSDVCSSDLLLLGLEQRIEGMEEFFLRGVLAGEELDVVDEQRVDRAEAQLELVHALGAQGLDHRTDELLRTQVQHLAVRVVLAHQVAGGVHQVGLAQDRRSTRLNSSH